jgi:hypothetical protein
MHHAYTQGQLVEQPARALFSEIGWKTVRVDKEIYEPFWLGTSQWTRIRSYSDQ